MSKKISREMYLRFTAAFIIALVLTTPFYLSSTIALIDESNPLQQYNKENIIKTSLDYVTGAQTASPSYSLPDPAQACIEKNEKTHALVELLDNDILNVLERIIRVLHAINSIWVSFKGIYNSMILLLYTLAKTTPCDGACEKIARDMEDNRNIIEKPFGTGGLAKLMNYLVSCQLPDCIPSLCGVTAELSGGKVNIDPFANIYTAVGCLCLPGILINMRKMKTIYQTYNCCVEQACQSGVNVDVCDQKLDEALCMFWGKGSIILGLANALISSLTSFIYQTLLANWVKELPPIAGTIISIARIAFEVKNLINGIQYLGKTFREPKCEDLGFTSISKNIQNHRPIAQVRLTDSNNDKRIDSAEKKVDKKNVEKEDVKKELGDTNYKKVENLLLGANLITQLTRTTIDRNGKLASENVWVATTTDGEFVVDRNGEQKKFTDTIKDTFFSTAIPVRGVTSGNFMQFNGKIYDKFGIDGKDFTLQDTLTNDNIIIPLIQMPGKDFQMGPFNMVDFKKVEGEGPNAVFIKKDDSRVKINKEFAQGWVEYKETKETSTTNHYQNNLGLLVTEKNNILTLKEKSKTATIELQGGLQANPELLNALASVGISNLENSKFKMKLEASQYVLDGEKTLFGVTYTITIAKNGLVTDQQRAPDYTITIQKKFEGSAISPPQDTTVTRDVWNTDYGQISVDKAEIQYPQEPQRKEEKYYLKSGSEAQVTIDEEQYKTVQNNPEESKVAYDTLGKDFRYQGDNIVDIEGKTIRYFTNGKDPATIDYRSVQIGSDNIFIETGVGAGVLQRFEYEREKGKLQEAFIFDLNDFEEAQQLKIERIQQDSGLYDPTKELFLLDSRHLEGTPYQNIAIDSQGNFYQYSGDEALGTYWDPMGDQEVKELSSKLGYVKDVSELAKKFQQRQEQGSLQRKQVSQSLEDRQFLESMKNLQAAEAGVLFDQLVKNLIGDVVHDAVEDMCKKEQKSSEPAFQSPLSSNPSPNALPTQFNPVTNTTNTNNNCGQSSVTTLTAQASAANTTSNFLYQISYTVTACKQDLSYNILFRTQSGAETLITGGTMKKGDTKSETKSINSSLSFKDICISVNDNWIINNGTACFPVVS